MELKVIAYARNGHTDKFGIPRQSRSDSPIVTRVVLEPAYSVREALRGIEGYSHLWLVWGFSEVCETATNHWHATVRPPRLGGNKRMGVFATRSPFRPNPIGLTSVELVGVEQNANEIVLMVKGADLLDGTPIYDIKPYLSFSDSHPNAKNGFAEQTKDYALPVVNAEDEQWPLVPRDILADIRYILSQDPRPAYQNDAERAYKIDYSGFRITFSIQKNSAEEVAVSMKNGNSEDNQRAKVIVKNVEKM